MKCINTALNYRTHFVYCSRLVLFIMLRPRRDLIFWRLSLELWMLIFGIIDRYMMTRLYIAFSICNIGFMNYDVSKNSFPCRDISYYMRWSLSLSRFCYLLFTSFAFNFTKDRKLFFFSVDTWIIDVAFF